MLAKSGIRTIALWLNRCFQTNADRAALNLKFQEKKSSVSAIEGAAAVD